jgi:hypothetical protein
MAGSRLLPVAHRSAHFRAAQNLQDKLHREDKRITRAVAQCAAAEELYDVGRVMDVLFGYGDGRLLLRASAESIQTSTRSGAMPGLTRSGVTLTREPGHLLENLPAYSVALRGKVAMKREQRGSHNLGVLVDAGRRLTAVDLVAFATLFKDVMERAVAPWAAAIQSSSLEPWVINLKYSRQLDLLRQYDQTVRCARRMVRVLVLLRSHAPLEDVRRFAEAIGHARPEQLFDDHRRRPGQPVRGRASRRALLDGLGPPSFSRLIPTFWHGMLLSWHPRIKQDSQGQMSISTKLSSGPPSRPDHHLATALGRYPATALG